MHLFASILAVATVATAQVCSSDGKIIPSVGGSPDIPPCDWYMPAQTVPSTGGSVANGYRSAKATIKNEQWAVFNLDFKDITNLENTFPQSGWSQWIGVKVEKSNTGGLKNMVFAWDGAAVGTQTWDSLWYSGADWLGPYQPSSGSLTTNVKSEAFYCYPVSGFGRLTGLKVAVQADCSKTATSCPLGSDYRVTPFTYYAKNKWSGSSGVLPNSIEASRGFTDWKTGGSSTAVGVDAVAITDGQGTSGWTLCPQAMNADGESKMYLKYDANEFQPEFIWRWPVQTEAFTSTFNTQLFFQQTLLGNNDDKNRWFNAPASNVIGVRNPADILRTAFTEVTSGQNDAPGFAGQTVYIKRQSNENGLNLFAEVTGDAYFLASGKASLCFTSEERASFAGFPGRSNSAMYYGLQPVGYAAERKTTCDLGCYPNADCKFAGLKVGGLSMGNFLILEPAGTGFYATVIIADTSNTNNLYPVGHQVAFAFGHAPNSASSVGLSTAAVLLMAAAAML